MKKTLILTLLLAPIFSFASVNSCQKGDLFDVNSGKSCAVASLTEDQKVSLLTLIDELRETIKNLQNQIKTPNTTAVTTSPSVCYVSGNVSIEKQKVLDSIKLKMVDLNIKLEKDIAENKIPRGRSAKAVDSKEADIRAQYNLIYQDLQNDYYKVDNSQ